MRLAALGVNVSAALVGLANGKSAGIAGLFLSLGCILACLIDNILGTWARSRVAKHTYSKLHGEGEGEEDHEVELTESTDKGDTGGAAAADDYDPPPSVLPAKQAGFSPLARALGLAAPSFYFAFLRGLQLGADLHVLSSGAVEVALMCFLFQVVLLGTSISVGLQDTEGLNLPSAALSCGLYSMAAPLGLAIGVTTTTWAAGASYTTAAITPKGVTGLGYEFPVLNCLAGGALLYVSLGGALPKEARDAAAEDAKGKVRRSTSAFNNRLCFPYGDALISRHLSLSTCISFQASGKGFDAQQQLLRALGLAAGWLAMSSAHYMDLAPELP